ncbi:MAG: hypothetical protein GY739_21500 [Mesoflavibacter sp.]|nr:hypothetical protein [Mesoflavibacter sp.]
MPVKIFSKELSEKYDQFLNTMFEGLNFEGNTKEDFEIDDTPKPPPPPPIIGEDGKMKDGIYQFFLHNSRVFTPIYYEVKNSGTRIYFLSGDLNNLQLSVFATYDPVQKGYVRDLGWGVSVMVADINDRTLKHTTTRNDTGVSELRTDYNLIYLEGYTL